MTKYLLVVVGILLWGVVGTVLAQTPTPTATPTSTPAPWPPDPNAIFADGVKWEVVPPTPELPTETPVVYPTHDPEKPILCNGWGSLEGDWTAAYRNDQDIQGYLCNTKTGEQRETLPPNDYPFLKWSVYATSEETKLLIGLGATFFVYDLDDDHYFELGTAFASMSDSSTYFCGWVSDTQGIFCTSENYSRSYLPEEYFVFDITKPDSMTPAFLGWGDDTFYEKDLNRYISVYSDIYRSAIVGGPQEHTPCHITIFDAKGLRDKELGYDCLPVFGDRTFAPFYRCGDYLYYLVVDDDETALTSLYRYSITDETIEEVIDARYEITNIIGVSPDEQYIVVLMDDDFERDVVNALDANCCVFTASSWQVAVLDIETGYPLYRSDDVGVYIPEQLTWTSDTTFILDASESYSQRYNAEGRFVEIDRPNSIWRIELPDRDSLRPGWRNPVRLSIVIGYSVGLPSPKGIYGLSGDDIITLSTFDSAPLLQKLSIRYDLDFEWETDHALLVTVWSDDYPRLSITYRVILP